MKKVKNDIGFIVIRDDNQHNTKQPTLLAALKRATELCKDSGQTFYVFAPIRVIKPKNAPIEISEISYMNT